MIEHKAGRLGQGKTDPELLFGLAGLELFGGRELGPGRWLRGPWRRARRRAKKLRFS